jgi:hypothetical protein
MSRHARGCRTCVKRGQLTGTAWEGRSQRVRIPYGKAVYLAGILSRAGPEESRLKLPAPSGKAKYS